jgi:tetratricopeptide (TPR) repeat protein
MNQHSLDLAKSYLEECAQLLGEFGDTFEFNEALSDLGLLAYLQHDFDNARKYHERTLSLFRKVGNMSGIEMALNRLGDVARVQDRYEEAEALYVEGLAIFRDSGDKDEIASLLHNLGYVAKHRGDLAVALSYFQEALGLQCELDNQAGIVECLDGIAAVLAAGSQPDLAARLFGAAEACRETMGTVLWPANAVERERSLAGLQDSISKERLDAEWQRGREMPIRQAVAQARSVRITGGAGYPSG